jgi:hypothetical protein
MAKAKKQSSGGRKQERHGSGGQDYEVRDEAKKAGEVRQRREAGRQEGWHKPQAR